MPANRIIFSPGTEFGKYSVISELGHGGMGAVYLVKHRMLNSFFALKILYSDKAGAESLFVERFIREAQLASQIKHPNLVGVYDVGFDSGFNVYFIVMEYISGGSLRDYLKKNHVVSELNALKIIYQTVSALQTASQWKMVHRDIKPDNIMFDSKGNAKLADLGIAKVPDEQTDSASRQMVGTPAYMSPEQVHDSTHVDERSDIYSLGIVLLEMLSGYNPQRRSSMMETLTFTASSKNYDRETAELKKNGISEKTRNLIRVMTASDPGNRPRTHQMLLTLVRNAAVALSQTDTAFKEKNSAYDTRSQNKAVPGKHGLRKILIFSVCLIVLGIIAAGSFGLYRLNERSINKWVTMHVKFFVLEMHTEPWARIRLVNEDSRKTYSFACNQTGKVRLDSCPAGKYTASVTCDYFLPITEFSFSVEKDQTVTFPKMQRRKMVLQLTGIKEGSSVMIAGEAFPSGITVPFSEGTVQKRLPAGYTYAVHVKHPNYFTFSENVFLSSPRQIDIVQILKKGDLLLYDSSGDLTLADLKLIRVWDNHQERITKLKDGVFSAESLEPADYQLTVSRKYFNPVVCTITVNEKQKKENLPVLVRKKGILSVICSRRAVLRIYRISSGGMRKMVGKQILDRLQTQLDLPLGIPYHLEACDAAQKKILDTDVTLKDETFREISIDKGY